MTVKIRDRVLRGGLFINELLAECKFTTRYFFVGLLMIADREGRIEYRPKRIKAILCPYDFDLDVIPLIEELVAAKFVYVYSADYKEIIQIPNYVKHQSIHWNESESDLPAPDISLLCNFLNVNELVYIDTNKNLSTRDQVGKGKGISKGKGRGKDKKKRIGRSKTKTDDTELTKVQEFREWKKLPKIEKSLYDLAVTYDHLGGIEWIASHTKDMEAAIITNPDKYAEYDDTIWPKFVNKWLKNAAIEKKMGSSGYKTPITSSQEQAHYKQHRNDANCRTSSETPEQINTAITQSLNPDKET